MPAGQAGYKARLDRLFLRAGQKGNQRKHQDEYENGRAQARPDRVVVFYFHGTPPSPASLTPL